MNFAARHIFLRTLLRWGAAVAFCIPLRHRSHFCLRAAGMFLPMVFLVWLLDPLAQSVSMVQVQLFLVLLYVSLFLVLGCMIYLCAEVDKKAALYCSIWSLLAAQTAFEGWNLLELFFMLRGMPLNMRNGWVILVQLLAGAAFYGIVCATLARKMPYKGEYHIGPRQLSSAFLIGILFMFQAGILSGSRALELPFSFTATVLVGQFYFLSLLYFQTELFKKAQMEKEIDALNLLYERQRQQYQIARQNVQIINKRCHELKIQIANLRRFAPETVPEQSMAEAERAARFYDANRNTGNEVLDIVLTEKSLLCESRQIRLNTVADGSCLDFFEAGDLYALFANVLDHAIESAVQVKQPERRSIDLQISVRQGFVVINVISPACLPGKRENRAAQYELKVLKRIVQKYNGTLTTETQGDFFAVKIIFPYKKAGVDL